MKIDKNKTSNNKKLGESFIAFNKNVARADVFLIVF